MGVSATFGMYLNVKAAITVRDLLDLFQLHFYSIKEVGGKMMETLQLAALRNAAAAAAAAEQFSQTQTHNQGPRSPALSALVSVGAKTHLAPVRS